MNDFPETPTHEPFVPSTDVDNVPSTDVDNVPSTDVDMLASRLLDGDIDLADVPPGVRDDVTRRREAFARQRQSLGHITGSTSETTIDRSVSRALGAYHRQRAVRRPRTIGVAAAAASVLVLAGLGLTRVGTSESTDLAGEAAIMVASDTAAKSVNDGATMNQSAVATPSLALTPDDTIVDVQSEEELRSLAETWSIEESPREYSDQTTITYCLTEPAARLLTRNARFRGQLVEIYLADAGDITVYAQSDCSLLLRLGA